MKTGTPTVTVAGGLATFTVAQTGNVGVGDLVTYGTVRKVYIRSVLSRTQVLVHDAVGAVPSDSSGTVDSITRAFNSIGAAVSGSIDASHLGNGNLVTGNRRLTWVCYNDGPFNVTTPIEIAQGGASPYTADEGRFVTLTVAGASQVASGVSQRHAGRAASGAVVELGAVNIGGVDGAAFYVDLPYTRIEWLEIDGNSYTGHDGIYLDTGAGYALLRNLIIHDIGANDATNCPSGGNDCSGIGSGAASVQIRNCLIYDYGQDGIYSGGTNVVVANTTLFRSKATGNVGEGLQLSGSATATAENVLSMGNGPDFCAQGVCGGTLTCNNCISSDNTADDFGGTGNLVGRVVANQFASTAAPVDLHLRSGSDAINAGKDLSASFSDDIDGQTRPIGAAWDVGADESGGQMLVKTGTYMGNGGTQSIAGVGFRPDLVIISADSTNAGVGTTYPSGHTDVLRTSTMSGNVSKAAYVYNYHPLVNRITSLDANGFSVGHPADHLATNDEPGDPYHCVNHANVRYYWVAFKAAPGEMAVGTYTGNGAATQDVTTVGFQPDYTLVLPDTADLRHRALRAHALDYCFDFDGGIPVPERVLAFTEPVSHRARQRLPSRPVRQQQRHDLPLRRLEEHAGPDQGG